MNWQPTVGCQLAGIQQLVSSLLQLDLLPTCLIGLLCLEAKHASPGGNVFWKSPLWKRGVIGDVAMLARAEMYKPPCQETIEVKMNAAFTDCQEAKQVSWI